LPGRDVKKEKRQGRQRDRKREKPSSRKGKEKGNGYVQDSPERRTKRWWRKKKRKTGADGRGHDANCRAKEENAAQGKKKRA